ncbi:hypothetical protein [Cytophaga hutchinsonii]|uniref:Outer membrane protein beta-barrel domain-containing protein n=1 Tax=Cytophaga hutchinsonii (strain ATCC 33406 / DSM 1761 / CIP 103989 / NBRC 15051 / NCIMB 9469 / D465) TaxID=269798 RepID=A0A6N4SW45_CYTH3|nr:hypothetical protein [Cytophaga hutchinsonii]ABG60843.1 hypothetical protein CHU_3610 [Cytophaga hutchinsonii ATCC 33406]SFX73015.1 hypothetical protein SAMN04487930_108168 [Cytophaga hutchinsonii ATCC 33406]
MKYFNAILFLLISLFASSQTVPENNGQIKVYDSYQPSKGSSFGQKNKISINPLGVLIGDYPVYYERMFGSAFSVELAAGVTYENYLGNLMFYGMVDNNSSNSNFARSYKIGNTYSISPKVYLDGDEFEGSYLALCYRHRLYNNDVTGYAGNNAASFTDPVKESVKLNSFTFNYGYVFTLGKGFILDYYIGLGLRGSVVKQAVETSNISNTYPYATYYIYDTETTRKTSPTGMVGFKIGYTF